MRLSIFASGNASILETILENRFNINLIVSNKKDSNAIKKAKRHNINYYIFDDKIKDILKANKIDLIILAGFIKKIDADLIKKYKNKIINIHPTLLPKYGGKGMYGIKAHKEVIKNKEKFSGVTVHFANEEYDKGEIILQEKIAISSDWDEYELEKHIKLLEKKVIIKTLHYIRKNYMFNK